MATATAHELSSDEARRLRARAQGLDASPAAREGGVVAVVAGVCGVQAQDRGAAALSVRARSRGLTAGDVERARLEDRSVVRTWAMRGTFHLVAAEDVGWLLGLLGPIFVAAGRRRLRELGLGDDDSARAVEVIHDVLDRGEPRTRAELTDELRRRGVDVQPGQAIVHLVGRAALEGVLCVGPDRDGKEAYVALDRWAVTGPPLEEDAALARLGRRYLAAYGPAGPADLAAWAGLPAASARRAWAMLGPELTEVVVAGAPAWILSHDGAAVARPTGPTVRLLPAFDTYLLGYRNRVLLVDDRHARRVRPGGGWIHPTVTVDGMVVATWRMTAPRGGSRTRRQILVEPFAPLDHALMPDLEAEAADVGRFLGVTPTLVLRPVAR